MATDVEPDQVMWKPFNEPLRETLTRTGTIAVIVGAILAWRFGGLTQWPRWTLAALWFSFGGHWVEVLFLNVLRPRLPSTLIVQIGCRIAFWFVGGVILAVMAKLTLIAVGGTPLRRWPAWWLGGLLFIGIEMVAHTVLQLRGRPSFFNGRAEALSAQSHSHR